MVEGARLLSEYGVLSPIEGSNPFPSAISLSSWPPVRNQPSVLCRGLPRSGAVPGAAARGPGRGNGAMASCMGFDFGTTNSVVALPGEHGTPRPVLFRDGDRSVSAFCSVLCFW